MISFYPGPSRVYDEIPKYVKEAHRAGLLSMNHRSEEFMALCKETVKLIKKKLNVPSDYPVFFTSSATECWEVIAQSLIRNKSTHLYNGAFGERWHDYTTRLVATTQAVVFEPEEELNPDKMVFQSDVICLTQNETSNGTQLSNKLLASVQKQNPDALIAVDATSSMAGIELDFKLADVWFASVQKCFGLPAGLAIMFCSPKAIERANALGERKHYNSLLYMSEMMQKWQTSCTPNVMGIYLLMRVMSEVDNIRKVDEKITARYNDWRQFFHKTKKLKLFIANDDVRSRTVFTITGSPSHLEKVKSAARKEGLLLGEGYGPLKKETFRIANFPALRKSEITSLMKFLSDYL